MSASRNSRACQRVALVGFLLLLPAAVACSLTGGDPLKQPEFLTPIAEAQTAGLVPYWLGSEFHAGGERFQIGGGTGFNAVPQGGPGLFLSYAARLGAGGTLTIQTFASDATLGDMLRQQASHTIGGHSEPVTVGSWHGELYSSPSVTRPVLFLKVQETTVLAVADAGGSGVPGQDTNVFLDRDTLIAALTALRPYPQ